MPRGVYNHKPHSEETKKKIGLKSKGRTHTDETKKKISEWQRGVMKTDEPSYQACHWRVRELRGKAWLCENLDCDGQSQFFEWANLTGNYEDIHDYDMMCRKCHMAYDKSRGTKHGRYGDT